MKKGEGERAHGKTNWLTGDVNWLSVRMSLYPDFVVISLRLDVYYSCDLLLFNVWTLLHLWPNINMLVTFITFVKKYYIYAFNKILLGIN